MNTRPGLIVMYHYVRPASSPIPAGIRPLLASGFETQLDWLAERYEVLPADQFLEAVKEPSSTQNPPCLLTFDDGTRDHAEVVTPILKRRGMSGVFFVLSGPCELGYMPMTHAIHWLLGGDEEHIWSTFERYANDHLGGQSALGDPAEASRIYHYESPLRARIKYAANMAFPSQVTERIVEEAVISTGRTMADLAAEWFVSNDDIRAMHAAGMEIASHGCTHRSLQSFGAAGMRAEIEHSLKYLADLIGNWPTWFACPFGGSGASPDAIKDMRAAMSDNGIVASVSTVKRYVTIDSDLFALPRLDTVDLPPRKSI